MTQGKPTIYIFLGLPGSGKTYFASNLAKKLDIVRLNSDAMRVAIFGSRDKAKEIYRSGDRKILNTYVFGAIDYATSELLANGQSVIQDANHNQLQNRQGLATLAAQYEGRVVLINIQTPRELALKRAQERVETADQRRHTIAELDDVYSRHLKNTDKPAESELVIKIDGTDNFEVQFASFVTQMEQIDE